MCPKGKEQRSRKQPTKQPTLRTLSPELGTIEMETGNLSLGGAYCLSERSIPPMTRLKLSIFLPSNDGRPARLHYPIEVDAVVVRAEPLNGKPSAAAAKPAGRGGRAQSKRRAAGPAAPRQYRLALFFADMAEDAKAALASYLRAARDS